MISCNYTNFHSCLQACNSEEDGLFAFDLHSDGERQRNLNATNGSLGTNGSLLGFSSRNSPYSCIQMNERKVSTIDDEIAFENIYRYMGQKQLIMAVEGMAAMGPHWFTILFNYLDKKIWYFNYPYSCVVQRSGWTMHIDIFFQWLSAIPFSSRGFNDAAISEGLAKALMMFSATNGNQTLSVDGLRQCILVAASNPFVSY
ncbi:unnamed protein product [Fraxinus pennsylvanica]|uniref:Mediator of RNA polymerase II transcription subunit 25 n=1 Tax=Fraxinus pennsylvanica TaxID=56036 RepID=A0AAD1ZGS1_9LAMI|nr:unnamed protein product [Fraxinus pennsylvanica]